MNHQARNFGAPVRPTDLPTRSRWRGAGLDRQALALLGELRHSRAPLYAALLILPYAGVLMGLDVAAHYGALTNAHLPVQF
ncbi:MAG: hypothetical protein LC634_04520, partial [Sphingomonadales bacterium]|nr:hypothetical protein [Sphingomonadales bacterium]